MTSSYNKYDDPFLPYDEKPIIFECHDIDGTWILVTAMRYLGRGKWLCLDEDGEWIVCDSATMTNPH